MKTDTERPIAIDLFCGAGGLSSGLEAAGFHTVGALDFDSHALASYRANHPNTLVFDRDVAAITGKELGAVCEGRELDLLAGGPSCQGFSTHGKRKADDPRNFLFEHFIRLAEDLRPRWILIENVPGLLTYKKGHFRNLIIRELNRIGYAAEAKVLLAADYGVPQLRKRIVFIANRVGLPISFPNPTHHPTALGGLKTYVTVEEAIGDLPLIFDSKPSRDYSFAPRTAYQRYVRNGSKVLTLHEAKELSPQAAAIAKHIKEGHGLRSAPLRVLPARFKKMRTISNGQLRKDCTTLYYRLDRARPAYTITCYFRNVASGPFLHPLENRSLSYREAARLMSFQDTYEFHGASLPRQIGNAVPPLMARTLGSHLLNLMQGRVGEDLLGQLRLKLAA